MVFVWAGECGNDGLHGLVKEKRWGGPFTAWAGEITGMGTRPAWTKANCRRSELCVGSASLLPPGPKIPWNCKHILLMKISHLLLLALPERKPRSQASPWWEMRTCTVGQGLSVAKTDGVSIKTAFKAQVHPSERIKQFVLAPYFLIWKTGLVKDQPLNFGKHSCANKCELLLGLKGCW